MYGVLIGEPMNIFDGAFFNELAQLNNSALMPPNDGFRRCLSELHDAGKISDDFARVTRVFDVICEAGYYDV
jgi:hypothetical protein